MLLDGLDASNALGLEPPLPPPLLPFLEEHVEEAEEPETGDKMLLLFLIFRPVARPLPVLRAGEEPKGEEPPPRPNMVPVLPLPMAISQSEPELEPGGVGGRPSWLVT